MTNQFAPDKCLSNPCEGCALAQLTDGDWRLGGVAISSALVDPNYAHLRTASVSEVVGIAEQATTMYGVRNLKGPVAGALALKATGRCED